MNNKTFFDHYAKARRLIMTIPEEDKRDEVYNNLSEIKNLYNESIENIKSQKLDVKELRKFHKNYIEVVENNLIEAFSRLEELVSKYKK